MNPVIVYHDKQTKRHFAWNEDGRMVTHASSYDTLARRLRELGYYQVSPNSRIAATIRDKMRLRGLA